MDRASLGVGRDASGTVNQQGSVSVVVAAAVAILVLGVAALGALGQVQAAAVRAQTAADAAALAAAVASFAPAADDDPEREAHRLARANGAILVECLCPADPSFRPRTMHIRVRVELDVLVVGRVDVERDAAAEFVPMAALGY